MKQYIRNTALVLILALPLPFLQGQETDHARYIIKTLSSPEYMGRGYTGEADRKAAAFIAKEFSEAGLKYFGSSYYQEFNIDVNTFPGKMMLKSGDSVLQAGRDFIPDPKSGSLKGKFHQHTILKQDLLDPHKIKKAIRKSRGGFLVIDERECRKEHKTGDDRYAIITDYFKYSRQSNNIGTIVLTGNKLTWGISSWQVNKPAFTVRAEQDFQFGSEVEVNLESRYLEKYSTSNLVGYLEGTEYPDSFIVLTAHYDHLGTMGDNVYIPGANDNASGVAMLLELADYFGKNPPPYSVAFIALSAEELGLLGAKHYTSKPLFPLKKISFLVNFDLAGTGDEGIKVVNASVFPQKFKLLQELNRAGDLLPAVKPRGDACISDHCMFHEKGVPSFYIYTLGGIDAYHDIYDRYETLPLTEFADYKKLMIAFIERF